MGKSPLVGSSTASNLATTFASPSVSTLASPLPPSIVRSPVGECHGEVGGSMRWVDILDEDPVTEFGPVGVPEIGEHPVGRQLFVPSLRAVDPDGD
jgi:hypothetical protein